MVGSPVAPSSQGLDWPAGTAFIRRSTMLQAKLTSGRASLGAFVSGEGAPVVFLHANVCDSRMWDDQLRGVAATHTAIAYDRRGFGATRAAPEDHSAVGDLMAVIDATAGGEPVILIGCSQGGKIAIDAALSHPSRIRGLVLIAPSVGGAPDPVNPPEIAAMLAEQKRIEGTGDAEKIGALKARLWLDGPLAPEGRVGGQARALFREMGGTALRSPPVGSGLDVAPAYDRLAEIAVPVLVLWGTLDFPHIQDRSRRIAGMLPRGSSHELDGVAHLPSLERPEVVTALVVEFVRRVAAATSLPDQPA